MQNKFVWSFLSLVTLAAGGLLGGCDSDAKLAKSSAGESCDKTSDCDDGLKCLEGTCYKSSSSSGGSANAGGEGNTAGTTVVGPKPPVLGGPGESCTKRADCEDGLSCIAERCTEDGGGMGGEGSVGPTLGGPGETCGLTSDCADGLRCLPNGYNGGTFEAKAIGSNSVGVCTQLDSGLKPTGKMCGAECAEAADCCEIPVAKQAALGAYSCADLAALVAEIGNCDTAGAASGGPVCLAYAAYCDENCGKSTWSCDAGKCSYTAKCTKAGEVVGGCPTHTRGGHLISACDTQKSNKCQPVVTAVVGCNNDAKCAAPTAMAVADSAGDTCSEGECACHVETGLCYRKCSEDLDCRAGYRCDDDTSLCVPVDTCSTNAQCAVYFGDARATCTKGVCQPPGCEHDIDCNPYGLVDGTFSKVCVDKACVPLGGCNDTSECGAYTGTAIAGLVRSFCTTTEVPVTAVVPVSAITD